MITKLYIQKKYANTVVVNIDLYILYIEIINVYRESDIECEIYFHCKWSKLKFPTGTSIMTQFSENFICLSYRQELTTGTDKIILNARYNFIINCHNLNLQ